MQHAIFIAVGSNIIAKELRPKEWLQSIVNVIFERGIKIKFLSSVWSSKAWPNPKDPPFWNAVFCIESQMRPEAILRLLHEIEAEMGRVRGEKNAPRTLDLDLIAYGDYVINCPDLVVPHPRAHERGFVMGPLAEIAPDWEHPLLKKTARELYQDVTVGRDAYVLDDL